MKRIIPLVLAGSTALLVFLIAKDLIKHPDIHTPHFQETSKIIQDYAEVKTRPLADGEYLKIIKDDPQTNTVSITDEQRDKLNSKLAEFYTCYTTGDFESFKQFQLDGDYTPSEHTIETAKKAAAEKGVSVSNNNEDILHAAWDYYNGKHKITSFDPATVEMNVFYQKDVNNISWRRPSNLLGHTTPALRCWDTAINLPQSISAKQIGTDGTLLAVIDQFCRFDSVTDGPATPLRLVLYWDKSGGRWVPMAMCTTIKVGDYDTLF